MSVTYRGSGVWGERSALARAMARAFANKGFGLDVGIGVFEHAVDQVMEAREAYVDEAAEMASRTILKIPGNPPAK